MGMVYIAQDDVWRQVVNRISVKWVLLKFVFGLWNCFDFKSIIVKWGRWRIFKNLQMRFWSGMTLQSKVGFSCASVICYNLNFWQRSLGCWFTFIMSISFCVQWWWSSSRGGLKHRYRSATSLAFILSNTQGMSTTNLVESPIKNLLLWHI